MEVLFQKYTAAFDSLDATAIARLYTLPCAVSDGDGPNVFSTVEALTEKFESNCQMMRAMGYASSDFNILNITNMGDLACEVQVGWRVHTQSSVIEFRALYICHLIESDWFIFNANVYQGSFE